MRRLLLAWLLLSVGALADMRGEYLCDVSPDEAAMLTAEVSPGVWRVWNPAGLNFQSFSSEQGAANLGWGDKARVCNVEVILEVAPRRTGLGVFYRLGRSLQKAEVTENTVYAGEFDVRQRIVGRWKEVPEEAALMVTPQAITDASGCIAFSMEASGHDRWLVVENVCTGPVTFAWCHRFSGDGVTDTASTCGDYYRGGRFVFEPGEKGRTYQWGDDRFEQDGFLNVSRSDVGSEYEFVACAAEGELGGGLPCQP